MAKKIIVDGQEIECRRRKNNNKAVYGITWGAILLLTTVVGWLITTKSQSDTKMEKIQTDYVEIKSQLSGIQESISWIKDTLQDKYKKRGGEEK